MWWRRVLTVFLCLCSIEFMTRTNVAWAQQPLICRGPQVQETMPVNITVGRLLQPVVARLLSQSDTFRAQCARVAAAPFVRIDIVVMSVRTSFVRARGRIRKTADGRIEATIEIPICRDAPELVVHEMEHVIEQMDGLDLAALARARQADVHLGADGAFETARARRAGEAAAAELAASSAEATERARGRRSWLGLIK